MDCKEAYRKIQESIDDDAIEPSTEILAHVEQCVRCRQRFADLKALAEGLNLLADVTPPPAFKERVLSRARNEFPMWRHEVVRERRALAHTWLSAILIWAKGAAVMAVVVLAFGFLNLFLPIKTPTARVLSTDPLAGIVISGRDVSVPGNVIVNGNITVVDGNVTIMGKVEGDVRVIRGTVKAMDGSKVAGRVVLIESPVAQARDAVLGSMDWFLSIYRQFTFRMVGR